MGTETRHGQAATRENYDATVHAEMIFSNGSNRETNKQIHTSLSHLFNKVVEIYNNYVENQSAL